MTVAPGNHLGSETSPYLLQHADNPVHWYPWGDQAFEIARTEDKAVLVSIGYSACHWCHVMEHESFENPEIAALMNELFVCVKVDREERPDVDEIYMTATQMMGLGGGWPLNVFVAPDRRPFYGGTYFPPEDRFGRPGWPSVLRQVAAAWANERDQILAQSGRVIEALDQTAKFEAAEDIPEAVLLERSRDMLARAFDETLGGFGAEPKFPPTLPVQLLLRRHKRTGNAEDLAIVEKTLRAMAEGGIYDQLGGGFHRYSTDAMWLVPHFEKMLYDNALLSRVYVEAWQVTGDEFYERIARETLDYVLREMTESEGGFRSATDADSDGREGVFFVWRKAEIEKLLGKDAELFCEAYGVTEDGHFEDVHHPRQPGEQGMCVLHVAVPVGKLAAARRQDVAAIEKRLAAGRKVLFEARKSRTYPGLDDKVLSAWNGLMIGAFAYAGRVLDEPRYRVAAERAADFVLREMRAEDGRLLRTHRRGRSKIPAFLDDYAFVSFALLDLYEATFDVRWFREAQALAGKMNELFGDPEGGWHHTEEGQGDLVSRFRSPADGAVPGGNGVAVQVMVRLMTMTGDAEARERATDAMRLFRSSMERMPTATLGLVIALDMMLHEDGEVAFVGDPESAATRELLRVAQRPFFPGTVFALLDPDQREAERLIPLLEGKTLVGDAEAAAYVCRNFACRAPVTTASELETALSDL